jgi:hypothetical protein
MIRDLKFDYPYWKKLAWRFARSGIAGGVATMFAVNVVLEPDLSNYQQFGAAMGSAFVAGVIGACGKAIRDHFSEGDKRAAIEKLPL